MRLRGLPVNVSYKDAIGEDRYAVYTRQSDS